MQEQTQNSDDRPFKDCIECPFCIVKRQKNEKSETKGEHQDRNSAEILCSPLDRCVGTVDIHAVLKGTAKFEPPRECPFRNNNQNIQKQHE